MDDWKLTDEQLDRIGFPADADARLFWRAFVPASEHADDFVHGLCALAAGLPSDWTVARLAIAAGTVQRFVDSIGE